MGSGPLVSGPRLVVGFDGPTLPAEVVGLARRGALAGVCLFDRNIEDAEGLRALVREVHGLFPSDLPPIVAVDQEGGLVQRLKPPKLPDVARVAPMREAAAGGVAGLEALGEAMGADLLRYGVNVDLAPVLDVDSNPDNPVIGSRAFARTAAEVAALGLAFARGLARAGVAACGKHFPGHGDTASDSHLTLPVVAHDAARLDRVELAPFAAAVEAGLPLIMTAHVVYPALDADWPATLSPRVVPDVLRGRLGYDGVVVSDDLDMAAIKGRFDVATIARGLAAADVDLALVCRDLAFAEALAEHLGPSARAAARVTRLRRGLARGAGAV